MKRCKETIRKEIYHLDLLCNDWASWDDTYEFMNSRDDKYICSNLVTETFYNNNLSAIALIDLNGNVALAGLYDEGSNSIQTIHSIPKELLLLNKPDNFFNVGENPFSGVTMAEKGVVLFSSRSILTSENKGPSRGTFLITRVFNDKFSKSISDQIQVPIIFHPLQIPTISEGISNILKNITSSSSIYIDKMNDNILKIYSVLNDIYNKPIFLVQVDLPRSITAKGHIATRFAVLSIIGIGFLTLLVMLILLKINVVNPILELKDHALSIGRKDALHSRILTGRVDEIGLLANEFDVMMEKLSEAREKLMEQSYRSGFSEMAADVLHNVRNTLSPVTTRLDNLLQDIMSINVDNIKKAQNELTDSSIPTERKNDLKQYLFLSTNKILDKMKTMGERVNDIIIRLINVEKILNDQETYSHEKHPVEMIKLNKLINDSINSLPAEMKNGISFEIDPNLDKIEPFKAPRFLLLKVFVNLLAHSVESIKEKRNQDGKVKVSVLIEEIERKEMVHLKLEDNGMGIENENLTRIFERDYRAKNRSIEGLHWCANMINKMDGILYAASDGVGQGESFNLLIPLNQENRRCEAKGHG
ncbi:HAMP domain-containing protein [bacterium]|nr:HAMP domain-containing protein [bacterium]